MFDNYMTVCLRQVFWDMTLHATKYNNFYFRLLSTSK